MNLKHLKLGLGIGILGFFLGNLLLVRASAQSPGWSDLPSEVLIDKVFKGEIPKEASKKWKQASQLLEEMQSILGPYEGLTEDGENYIAQFEGGSLPVIVDRRSNGKLKSFGVDCPQGENLNWEQAPQQLQEFMDKCFESE